ncbi:MAG: HNH endonuclease, partial [Cocleimonas sp.]
GEDIYALSQKKGGYNCEDVQGVSNTLAKHVGDFVLSAGVAKFDGFTKKFKFNRNKKDPKDIYKGCKGTVTFGGKKLNIPKCAKGKGTWGNKKNKGKQGDSLWIPAKGTPLAKALKKYGKKGVKFNNGYPVFEPFAYTQNGVKAVMDIGYFNNPENQKDDMDRAAEQYKQKLKAKGVLNADNWPWPPTNSKGNAPAGWNWHHHQNGKTMILVSEEIHLSSKGGVRHCGGIHCL